MNGFCLPSSPSDIALLRSLSHYGKAVDAGLVSGTFTGSIYPGLEILHHEVFSSSGNLLPTTDYVSVKRLRQLSLLFSKCRLPCEKGDDDLFEEFNTRQINLRRVKVPRSELLFAARDWMRRLLSGLSLCDIEPSNGPGAVAEGLTVDDRYAFPTWYSPAERAYPSALYGTYNSSDLLPVVSRGPATTRVVCVPKDFRKNRLISVEPASQQFLQQGQMRALYRWFARSSLIGKYVRLENQAYNHELLGKLSFDTIDLSNASDTVSAALVWFLMPSHLRQYLFRTRSSYARFGSRVAKLSCFAPMGSAVCFPVETLVFLSLILSVWTRSLKRRPQDLVCRVYGDDCIVPDIMTDEVLNLFISCGMEPNRQKTCRFTPFRESCGKETFFLNDVTVVKLRWFPTFGRSLTEAHEWVVLNQVCFQAGLTATAHYAAEQARKIYPVPTISSSVRAGFLLAHYADYSGCNTRWNRALQRMEVMTCFLSRGNREWTTEPTRRLFARLLGDFRERAPARALKTRTGWKSAVEYC